MKIYFFFLLVLLANRSLAQPAPEGLKLKLGNADKVLLDKVQLTEGETEKRLALKDGTYEFTNGNQTVNLVSKGALLNGTATLTGTQKEGIPKVAYPFQEQYKIRNSYVVEMTRFINNVVVMEARREPLKISYKTYYLNGILKSEGWMSLDRKRNYGTGISKDYFQNGTLSQISNQITETYTEFYPNGKPKRITSRNVFETYRENGDPDNKQYTKNAVRYNDYYAGGKLLTRAYKNGSGNEVTEYYEKGVLEKKEVVKNSGGEKRLLTYDKAGKLIQEESYSGSGVKSVEGVKMAP